MFYRMSSIYKRKKYIEGTVILLASSAYIVAISMGSLRTGQETMLLINIGLLAFGLVLIVNPLRAKIGVTDKALVVNKGLLSQSVPLSAIKVVNIYKNGKYITIAGPGSLTVVEYVYTDFENFISDLERKGISLKRHVNKKKGESK